jgi:hypothetical protein
LAGLSDSQADRDMKELADQIMDRFPALRERITAPQR